MKKRQISVLAISLLTMFALSFGMVMTSGAAVKVGNAEQETADGDFSVKFSAIKPVVKVDEKIRFKVEGSKKFYLYLFTVNEKDEGYVLLPNKKQQYNIYQAGKEYLVPEKNIEFVADAPGVEEITMVASTKKLKLDEGQYKVSGQFFSAKSKVVENEVKSLRVRSKEKKAQYVVQTVKIVVTGKAASVAPVGDAVPFVSCDKRAYKNGDELVITYGADKAGFIYLWSLVEGEKPTFLTKVKVDGEKLFKVDAVAEAPFGKQKLVAVWDKKGDLKEDKVNLSDVQFAKKRKLKSKDTSEVKGLSLTKKPASIVVYEFTISK